MLLTSNLLEIINCINYFVSISLYYRVSSVSSASEATSAGMTRPGRKPLTNKAKTTGLNRVGTSAPGAILKHNNLPIRKTKTVRESGMY